MIATGLAGGIAFVEEAAFEQGDLECLEVFRVAAPEHHDRLMALQRAAGPLQP